MQTALQRLGVILGTASILACVGPVATAQGHTDLPPYPLPGRLVDIGGWRLHLKTSGPLRVSDIPAAALAQMRAGAAQLSRHPNDPPRDRLPVDAQRMRAWALGQLGHIAAGVNPFEHEERAALRAERVKDEYPLGDIPLIVITRGVADETGTNAAAMEEEHRTVHAALAALSRRGKEVIATHSGHHVQLEEPELVVSMIRQVTAAARK